MNANQLRLLMIVSSGFLFGLVMGILDKSLTKGLITGILFGVIWGFSFSFLLFHVNNSTKLLDKNFQLENPNNEKIIFSYFATLIDSAKIGGRLYLLETTLQFLPYKTNPVEHKRALIIPLNTITELKSYKLFGYAPTGLDIMQTDNKFIKLILLERPTWIKLINEQIAKLKFL